MRVLHIIGSSLDDYMFKVSWFYGKNCPLDILNHEIVQYDYTIVVPPLGKSIQSSSEGNEEIGETYDGIEGKDGITWYFVEGGSLNFDNLLPLEGINENQFLFTGAHTSGAPVSRKRHPNLPKCIIGPLSLGQFMTLIEQRPKYDLHLPQSMDFLGMTTMRNLFENILCINHPGPNGMTNVLAQNKALTKSILQNAPGVKFPKTELLYRNKDHGNSHWNVSKGSFRHDYHRTDQYPSMPLPFIVKPTEEDNSRGVSLCEKPEDVLPALKSAFQYGDCIMVEEFIPGRELRAACVEDMNGVARVPSCKLEFVLEKQIRRTEDKLTKKLSEGDNEQDSHVVLTKYNKEYLIPGVPTQNVPPTLEETLDKIDTAVLSAHRALGFRDFSLFDFRIHDVTGDPYIIESCSFWTFTPVSAISGLLDRSKEFFVNGTPDGENPHLQDGCWKNVARHIWERTAARKAQQKLSFSN